MQRINISSGIYTERAVAAAPLHVDIPFGVDTDRYGDCLRREGFDEAGPTIAYFKHADACRAAASAPLTLHLAPGADHQRLSGGFDEAAYRACLDSSIAVEVTLPE